MPNTKPKVSASLSNPVDHSSAMQSSQKEMIPTMFGQLIIVVLMDGQDVSSSSIYKKTFLGPCNILKGQMVLATRVSLPGIKVNRSRYHQHTGSLSLKVSEDLGAIPGVESIYGPLLVGVPIRTVIEKEQSLRNFVQGVQTQLFSATQHERSGYPVAARLFGFPQMSQCYLSWHPHDEDALSKDLAYKGQGDSTVILKPRRDLSTPFSANFELVLDVYEQKNSLDLYISWDKNLRSQSDTEQLMETFVHNLDQLVGSSCLLVGDLWPGR